MRLVPLVLSLAILGISRNLEAAKPARKAVHVSGTVYRIHRGETAAKVARKYGLSLETLADLNPRLNLSKLAVGTALKVKGQPEAKIAKVIPEAAQPESDQASYLPVSPIPVIRANAPGVLVHLERLLPTSMDGVPVKKTARAVQPMSSQDLVPVFPSHSGLEYESQVIAELGFEPADPNALDFLWPVATRSISSSWGPRMRTRTVRVVKARKARKVRVRYKGSHKGVDLTAPMGTDVYAAQDGRVVSEGRDKGYGNFVFIDHGNGVETRYAHHRANFVQEGDIVRRGQKIAEVGSTGRSTGPHLHFEFRLGGEAQNPMPLLNDEEEIPAEMVALNEMIKGPRR